MIARIVQLLQQRKPNAPNEWLKKLPQMAKRLEESLYRSAKSFEEYNDTSTLKQRLQQLAVNIGMKTKKMQQQAQLAKQQQLQAQAQQRQQVQAVQQQYQVQPQQVQQQQVVQHGQQLQAIQQPVMQQPVPAPAPRQMVNMAEINPMMQATQQRVVQAPAPAPVAPAPQPMQISQVQYQAPVATQPAPAPPPAAPTAAPGTGGRQVSDRQQVLRHQQQRLLLLRHAAKCQHEDGRCPVTPHCAGMKRLWKHIAECKDQKCLVPHCVSSRYVLSHYHRCKDVRCPVCGPVREAIHRSHEKQKQMQALKQRHQQAVQQNQLQGAQQQQQQPQPPPAGALSQPPQPTPIGSVPVPDIANKRRRTTNGAVQPQFPPARVQTAVPQPGVAAPPSNPNVKAGYVYSHPQAAAPGQPVAPGLAYSNGQVIMPKHTGPKPQEDHTLINCFTIDQIETHITSLNKGLQLSPAKLKAKCLDVLKVLQAHQHGWVFNAPVDPVELGLPDYFEVIKRPMDLGTIRKKLENGCYHSLEEFEGHVHLTFDNAMLYNPEGSVVYNMAKEMKTKFHGDYQALMQELNAEEDSKRKNGEACLLCGCEKLLFEPPVFYCNGLNCPSKRIRRNSYYYVGTSNQYHWCHQCYQELGDQSLVPGDASMRKELLTKKKNDEVHEESWVQCDRCERWIHQICALFNTRQNKDQRSEYVCPRCTIADRRKKGMSEGTSTTPMAEDLQRTKLSERLEKHVRVKVSDYFEKAAREKSESEKIPLEEAKKGLHMGGQITIRQVTSMDRKLEVRERMKKRYAFKNYPDEFTFRCKCIVVFQNLDGVDVILFGLYVYEHDETNPAPNQRAVYVSYLDSVHYMRPRRMRTLIYHEILISYLDYVRQKGFSTAHIWACPPLKGDDYILYAKPEDQKTPKDDRLRQWYLDMLVECQRRGIVGKVTNMHDLYFAHEKNDATVVPYMDGDYFPAEAENIIKDIEEGKTGKSNHSVGTKKKGSTNKKNKKKSGRGGTRSTGLDEDALAASGILQPGMDQKSLEQGGRDFVMVKLSDTIQPMKESFIVAYLTWSGAAPENLVVPPEIQEYRNKHGIVSQYVDESKESNGKDEVNSGEKENGKKPDEAPVSQDNAGAAQSSSATNQTSSAPSSAPAPAPANAVSSVPTEAAAPTNGSTAPSPATAAAPGSSTAAIREGKFAAMAARQKRGIDGKLKPTESEKATKAKKDDDKPARETVKDSKGRTVTVLDDDKEEMDCEFLNNRQAFLNLCQGNHYQFDQLRRAKHSSMMVLWHLHNRDAPKFVQQCASCSREILTGYRYHCPTCADYDQCHDCVSNPNTPRHPHPLKPIPVTSGQQAELTEAQRKERQRSIQLHMTLLQHAATCVSPKCPSANCTKMKGLLKHGAECQVKAAGGCHVCKRIWALLQLHARQCKATTCPVPNCMAIRERFRQLKQQQQAMDDRRRQEMNRAYRGQR